VAGSWIVCGLGLAACALIGVNHPVMTMVALIFATTGVWAALPSFWSIPSALLTGAAAAGGLALINSVGSLGGLLGPWVFGLAKDASGSDNIALLCLALAPIIAALAVVVATHDRQREGKSPRA